MCIASKAYIWAKSDLTRMLRSQLCWCKIQGRSFAPRDSPLFIDDTAMNQGIWSHYSDDEHIWSTYGDENCDKEYLKQCRWKTSTSLDSSPIPLQISHACVWFTWSLAILRKGDKYHQEYEISSLAILKKGDKYLQEYKISPGIWFESLFQGQ